MLIFYPWYIITMKLITKDKFMLQNIIIKGNITITSYGINIKDDNTVNISYEFGFIIFVLIK